MHQGRQRVAEAPEREQMQGLLGEVIIATAGAVILIFILRLVRRL